jgi:hypothetical protein
MILNENNTISLFFWKSIFIKQNPFYELNNINTMNLNLNMIKNKNFTIFIVFNYNLQKKKIKEFVIKSKWKKEYLFLLTKLIKC